MHFVQLPLLIKHETFEKLLDKTSNVCRQKQFYALFQIGIKNLHVSFRTLMSDKLCVL